MIANIAVRSLHLMASHNAFEYGIKMDILHFAIEVWTLATSSALSVQSQIKSTINAYLVGDAAFYWPLKGCM